LNTGSDTSSEYTTLAGSLFLPSAINLDLLGSVKLATNSTYLTGLSKIAKAFVNGKACPITLNPTATSFTISEVPQASTYRIEILLGKISLKAHTKSKTAIVVDSGSTAAVLVAEKLNQSAEVVLASYSNDIAKLALKLEDVLKLDTASFTGGIYEVPLVTEEISRIEKISKGEISATNGSTAIGSETSFIVGLSPLVQISCPASGSTFSGGADIEITAVATDPDGRIEKVEFYQGSVKLGEVANSPYDFTWAKVPAGTYQITAKAVNTAGISHISEPIFITVLSNPDIEIVEPQNGASFIIGSGIPIKVEVLSDGGEIAKIEIYKDDFLLGEISGASGTYIWGEPEEGAFIISARMIDKLGNPRGSKSIGILVHPPINLCPEVALQSPTPEEQIFAGTALTLVASASDPDGTVSKVEFFQGNLLLIKLGEDADPPYTFTIPSVEVGTYTFCLKATDEKGRYKFSNPFTISVVPATASSSAP